MIRPAGLPVAIIAVALTTHSASADAALMSDLDKCLADPAKTQAVFAERFPHKTCDVETTCEPILVESAHILARSRCRTTAIDACTDASDPATCMLALTDRWQKMAVALKADIQARLTKLDPEKMSLFAVRRFSDSMTFETAETCPELNRVEAAVLLNDDALCGLYSGYVNVSRMEGLSNYLADQEARP